MQKSKLLITIYLVLLPLFSIHAEPDYILSKKHVPKYERLIGKYINVTESDWGAEFRSIY